MIAFQRAGWRSLACVTMLACSGDTDALSRTPVTPATPAAPGTPAAPATPAAPRPAALALAATFAPELVGPIVPEAPRAGDYAMALAMTFETFPSMEMRVEEWRTGRVTLHLASDGTARGCLGSYHKRSVDGTYKYKPDGGREHRTTEDRRLLGLGGRWTLVDGVATIQLDRVSWWSCDLARATTITTPSAELRCVAVGPTQLVPAGSLACEAKGQLLDLGMPMTTASRNVPNGPMHRSPEGTSLVLGAPGVVVEVTQGARAMIPAIAIRAGAVTLVEGEYRPLDKSPP